MGRPARKKCRAEAKATRAGELQAELEADRKKSLTTKVMELLKDHVNDVPKWVALLGMTILVKNAIEASEEVQGVVLDAAQKIIQGGPPLQSPPGQTPQLTPAVQPIPQPGQFPKVG